MFLKKKNDSKREQFKKDDNLLRKFFCAIREELRNKDFELRKP
jgi:hypothetical protein